MKKIAYYTYLGTNGVITSPIHLEDIYYTKKYQLVAEPGFKLTKNNKDFLDYVMVPDDEVNEWNEVVGQ